MFCFELVMEVWAIILIIVLFIILGLIIGLTWWTERENNLNQQRNILRPFAGSIDPNNPGDVHLTMDDGRSSQIQCPVGYNVNIVGAWVEVNDPFGECSNPSSTFKATCGGDSDRASAITCSNDGDCAEGMHCDNNKCMPSTCSSSDDCGVNVCPDKLGDHCTSHTECGNPLSCVPVPGKENEKRCEIDPSKGWCSFCFNGKCAQGPTCSNLNPKTFQNNTCANSNETTKCRPRDASAYLAAECDGKNVCNVTWNPNNSRFFGPLPCRVGTGDPSYGKLPIIPGWHGGAPERAKTTDTTPANYKQGYYVHGIYTCIKAD